MKQINVLGVSLKDYNVRESMRRITLYLNNGVCNTIDFITHDSLLSAAESPELKESIEAMDMTIFVTNDILVAGNASNRLREREINGNIFLKTFLRKLSKEGRSVYLISDDGAKFNKLVNSLKNLSPEINIIGQAECDNSDSRSDAVINEVNACVPDVVFVYMKSPNAEIFIDHNKSRMNTQIAAALRDAPLKVTNDGSLKTRGIGNLIMRKIFHSAAAKYDKNASVSSDSDDHVNSSSSDDPSEEPPVVKL